VRYVYSKAVHRNLTDGQKAAAAVGLLDELEKEGNARKPANLKQNAGSAARSGNLAGSEPNGQANGESREVAGTLFGVSGRYIQEAKLVRKQDPKLFGEVLSGAITLPRAKREIHRRAKRTLLARKTEIHPKAGTWRIEAGDCLPTLQALPRGKVRLIFADPPYNIGVDYGRGRRADQLPDEEYLQYWRLRLTECRELLTHDGSLWLLMGDEYGAEFRVMLRELFGDRGVWIKWYETFGANHSAGFNKCSRHLFYHCNGANCVFNEQAVRRPSDRQAKYGDKRAHPDGKLWDNVWGINPPIPRLVDNAKERVPGFPTQLPLALLRPIIGVASEPGDLVLDPCCGSATTGEAAVDSGRHFLGCELSPKYAALGRQRLGRVGVERQSDTETRRQGDKETAV
jgi:adenine-specific DNA-methyltransferase